MMAHPLDAIVAIHNAFRHDMKDIDAGALEWARGKPGQDTIIERYRFLNEVLVWHAHGEELAIFPMVEDIAPLVAEAYEKDHRGLDASYETLNRAVSARNALDTARATAAFKFHLDIHLRKEDTHLYRILRERVPVPELGKAAGIMSSTVPQDRFPEVVTWMFPLLAHNDRENMTLIWQMVMPPPVFSSAKQLIKNAIGNDDWAELVRRIPSLA
jgi:hemerythrin-like domain-containing protein